MRVILDERKCPSEATNVGQAVADAADLAERDGRLVIEVLVDGRPLSETDLLERERLESAAEEVRLVTTTIHDLLRETFTQASQALSEADEIQRNAARLVQSGDTADGMSALLGSLETWGSIRDAVVKGLALADIAPEEVVIDDLRLVDAITRLQDRLGMLKNAMLSQDVSATCDCLLYDLPESTSEWSALLAGLAGRFSSDV